MGASARPSRKLQEHGERRAFNGSTVHIRCSRDSLDCTPQTFINCGYAGILTPNITVKRSSTRGRPRPHTAILRHPFTAPQSEPHDTIDDQFSSQQQSLLRGNTCVVSGPIPLRQVLGDHQNRPSTCPSSPIRMLLAAGTLGNPGIVIISPQMATMNPAPAARRTSRMGTM